MNDKKLVVKKGYTIEVISWENDGDNYKTKYMTVSSIETAKAIKHLCETVFVSKHDNLTIGNKMEEDYLKCYEIVKTYLLSNPLLVPDDVNIKTIDVGNLWDSISHYNYDLLDSSEYYFSRVCESCIIYYSPEDVFADLIVSTTA